VWSVIAPSRNVRKVVVVVGGADKKFRDSKGGKKKGQSALAGWKLNLGVGMIIPSRSRLVRTDWQTLQQLRSSTGFPAVVDRFWHSGDFPTSFPSAARTSAA